MIHAIVFDIGGVLIRTEEYTGRIRLEEKFGLQSGELDQIVFGSPSAHASTIGLESEAAVWQSVSERLDISPDLLGEFKKSFWAGDRLDQKLILFLKDLRPDYITVLLSNAWKGARTHFSEKYGIKEEKTVDFILISSELGVAKPDPKIYHILAEKLECKFNEILFVDDFKENVVAARELGIHAIHFKPEMDLVPIIRNILTLN